MEKTVMELAPWQFWMQLIALVFLAGGGWYRLNALGRGQDSLVGRVESQSVTLVEVKTKLDGLAQLKNQSHDQYDRELNELKRRIERLEHGGEK